MNFKQGSNNTSLCKHKLANKPLCPMVSSTLSTVCVAIAYWHRKPIKTFQLIYQSSITICWWLRRSINVERSSSLQDHQKFNSTPNHQIKLRNIHTNTRAYIHREKQNKMEREHNTLPRLQLYQEMQPPHECWHGSPKTQSKYYIKKKIRRSILLKI